MIGWSVKGGGSDMGLEELYKEYWYKRPYRRKVRRQKVQEKKVAVAEVVPKKAVKEPHWCVRCDTGYRCGRK